MKICIEVNRNFEDWDLNPSRGKPIYPFPGSIMNQLSKNNIFSFYTPFKTSNIKYGNQFKIYNFFKEMINEVDIFIPTGGNYLKYLFFNYSFGLQKLITNKVIPIVYVLPKNKLKLDFYKYKLIYQFSRGQIYTSITQFKYAKNKKIGNPIFLPIGIDTKFYNESKSSRLEKFLIKKEYIVMHGDEMRNHVELIKLAELLRIGIIRINQYTEKDKYKNSIFEISNSSKNIKFIYQFQNVNFEDYITILKNSKLYSGLVDSNKFPNGWTAICEAKALNIPIISSEGYTSNDFKEIFKLDDNTNFLEINNVEKDKEEILRFYKFIEKNKSIKKYIPMTDYSYTSKVFQSQLSKKGIITSI